MTWDIKYVRTDICYTQGVLLGTLHLYKLKIIKYQPKLDKWWTIYILIS